MALTCSNHSYATKLQTKNHIGAYALNFAIFYIYKNAGNRNIMLPSRWDLIEHSILYWFT